MDLRKQIRLKKQLFEVVIISNLQDLNHVRNIPPCFIRRQSNTINYKITIKLFYLRKK